MDSQTPEVRQAAVILGDPLTLDQWLRHGWHFEKDPEDYEFVRSPALQLRQAAVNGGVLTGDCDDAATLAASILVAMRWPCRFVAIRQRTQREFSHVFLRVPLFGAADSSAFQWDIDPIVPADSLPLAGDFELMTLSV
jgi:hypothetical protein